MTSTKPLSFSDKCFFCGHTFGAICHTPENLWSAVAYKFKVVDYVNHRVRCSAEYFAKTERKVKNEM